MYNKDKIMRKLLGKAAVESSPSSSIPDNSSNLGVTSAPFTPAATLRPSVSQDAAYNAGVPIDCIDRSPDGHSAILAGRHILKTVKLDGNTVQEGIDIRAAILAQPFMKNSVNSSSDQLSIKDVKWLRGRGDTTIFTACASGKIFQYDLTRLGGGSDGAPMEVVQMREDSRQINTLDINPRSSYLLAGSQDGIVRCFDIMNPVRTHTGHLSFRAVQAFKCNAGGVQCIQWSPHADGAWSFACGTEQGVVLKWDIRKATAPVLRINAHDKACASLAWHPDGDHIVSGGWDNKCHVWDASTKADKRQKPKWTISTPAPVADVAWRPGTWSATAQGKRAAQLAVTYEGGSHARHGINACHVWDLARPTMPFKEVSKFDTSPSALLWHDQDLLWTAGQDGLFNQFDIAYASKVVDRATMSVLAFSSRGDVVSFLDERPQSRRPHRPVVPAEILPSRASYTSSPTVPMLSISRSDSEDEVAGNFLGARRARPKNRRAATGSRSVQSLSTTPPGGPDAPVMALEQSIKSSGLFKSQQAMTIGRAPSAAKVNVYEYLSTHYLETLHELLPYRRDADSLDIRIQAILEHYAIAAESVGQFRLSQVWRVLAFAMKLLLERRAQHHLDRRTGELERSNKATAKLLSKSPAALKALDDIPKLGQVQLAQSGLTEPDTAFGGGLKPPASVERASHLRSLLSEEFESTSQTTTPLARPVDSGNDSVEQLPELTDHHFEYGKKLTPVQEGGSFTLPPPLKRPAQRQRLDSEPLSTFSHDSDTQASTEGYDFYDTDAISQAIDVPGAKSQAGQEPPLGTPSSARRVVARHDSDESFGQMFSISSGSRQTTGLTASSSGSMQRRPNRITGAVPSNPQLARSASTGEYESRIRGAKLESTHPPKLQRHGHSTPARPDDVIATQSTEEDDPMITQTTMDSIESGKRHSHPRPDSFPHYTPQTVSLGVSPLDSFEFNHDPEQPQETDYLPWTDDPRYPHPIAWEDDGPLRPSPLDPYKLISRAVTFEATKSALHASAMVLLLRPLVYDVDDAIDAFQAAAIIKQQHSRLMGMKLFAQAALLRNLCVKGWPAGPLLQWGEDYPSVFRPAQSNNKAAFFCQTCRKPREVDRRNTDTQSVNQIWRCERCSAVMAPCAICRHREAPEVASEPTEISPELIRSVADAQDDEVLISTWWYCNGCGHGGHASCLAGWHSEVVDEESSSFIDDSPEGLYSDGCCPFDGCGHACLPGKYSAENNVARTEEVSRAVREVNRNTSHTSGTASPRFGAGRYSTGALDELSQRGGSRRRAGDSSLEGSVHGDLNEIPQSKAVESVRESLASGHASPMGGLGRAASAVHIGLSSERPNTSTTSILSSSPGRGGIIGGDRERRKSVKFAGSATVVSADDGTPRRQ
ncbi:hypothetical protein N8I77_011791 [Diaporthe amygdali]|uniref:Uncharacterized protein n=1 Tax=Phomopsis amygdali TaxID=1214568 RepID=A0AAD9S4U9_PHOAM|nr:hypothetical protein N8I77_011791 [Diaporthe amygdali]